MGIKSKYIWMDGELRPFEDAQVHLFSHTLHYGLGAFEGFQLSTNLRWRWNLQTRRPSFACSIQQNVPNGDALDFETVRNACIETLKANEFEEAYIRPIIYLGHGAMGLGTRNNPVRVAVASWEWGPYLGADGLANGIRVGTSSYTKAPR